MTAPAFPPVPSTLVTGALNFRDLGGYSTSQGQLVRRGLIYRSGELSRLTDADFRTLRAMQMAYVFDLRTDVERAVAKTSWRGDSPNIIPVPVGFHPDENPVTTLKALLLKGTDPQHADETMRAITAKIAIDGALVIGQVLRALANNQEPALIHCTAGKDRTGVVSAFLLTLLGVPMETVYEDYLKSNGSTPAEMERLKSAAAHAMRGVAPGVMAPVSAIPIETIKVLMGVNRSYLDAAFAAVNDSHGSFENYVREGMKFTPTDQQTLKARLLEPAR